jgi:hypothetical protein
METPWSIFEKVCLANHVTRTEVLRTFGTEDVKKIKSPTIGDSRRELIQLSGFDPLLLEQTLEHDIVGQNKKVISNLLKPIHYYKNHITTWFPQTLRWCEQCMSRGYHSWLHQFFLNKCCPIHNSNLIEHCPACLKSIPFLISDKSLGDPFTCKCGHKIANSFDYQRTEWNYIFDITDDAVNNWIGEGETCWGNNHRLLFDPSAASTSMIRMHPAITYRSQYKPEKLIPNEYLTREPYKELIRELYKENISNFRSIDNYIKNKLLCKHHNCIRILQFLKKEEEGDFYPICPYAYAYVFWRQTLLRSTHFYEQQYRLVNYGKLYFATKLLEPKIIDMKDRLMQHTNMDEKSNRNLIHWVINRYTIEYCMNFFYQWLHIARAGAEEISVPSWAEFRRMVDRSQPQIIYKHPFDVKANHEVEVVISPYKLNRFIENMECVTNTKKLKNEYKSLHSYTPMNMAMRMYDDPTDNNKELSRYVDWYVSRLKI